MDGSSASLERKRTRSSSVSVESGGECRACARWGPGEDHGHSPPGPGQRGNGLGVALSRTRGGGAAALTTGFRPTEGANNGVAVPGAPSPSSPARARPLSPKLLSI